MSFLQRFLTNHPLANITFAVVVIMGALAFIQMPREQDPEINFNWVQITTILPGASAEDVERRVTEPLEDAVRNLQDVRFAVSTSREGVSGILVRFRDIPERVFDKRISDLRREIQNKANSELPDEVRDPEILEITTSNGFPTALVAVAGQADDEVLREIARAVKEDIEQIAGVDRVLAMGLHDPELQVRFDPVALANRGITALDIANGLRASFRDVFAGKLDTAVSRWLVRVQGTTASPETLSKFAVTPWTDQNTPVPLDTLAEVSRGRADPRQLVSFNGQPAVSLSISKISRTNTLELVERISAYIERKNEVLRNSGVHIALADDQTIPTREALGVMSSNALIGLFLVLFVCWLFLGSRIATMVALGVVFSVCGALWILQAANFTLNVSVLLGIVIVLGMLVDDAVVIVEAIYFRISRGMDGLQAAVESLREVGAPVFAAVMTTMAAFLPLMLLPGIVGKFMFVIPFVVTVGLLVSLVEAFWILPSHVIGMGASAVRKTKSQAIRSKVTARVRLFYTRALIWALRQPATLFSIAGGLILCAIIAISIGAVRTQFFAFDPLRIFYVNVDMPPDAPVERTLAQTQRVEAVVREYLREGEARAITSMAGLKFTEMEPLYGDQYGQIAVSIQPHQNGMRDIDQMMEGMRAAVTATPGDADMSFLKISGGPPTEKPISVKVRGDDFVQLRSAADALKSALREIPGAQDITDNDTPGRNELVLQVDVNAARQAGMQPADVARLVRLHLDGEVVADLRDQGEKIELRVRGLRGSNHNEKAILGDPIALPDGSVTTLGALVHAETGTSRGLIRHHNLRRAITVEANLDKELIDTVAANNQLRAAWETMRVQYPGIDLDFSGELDDIQESLDAMGPLFLLGIGLIYLILAAQFRSYFQPMLILATVPLAFTGVTFGLLVSGNPLSMFTLYGVIALTGIAVNAAIVLIAAANQRVAMGMRTLHATVYAARRRVIPVLMTTATTIAGLFSLAVGLGGKSLLWGPVAASIVWGLGFATVLTLFVIPVLYRAFMKGRGGVTQN